MNRKLTNPWTTRLITLALWALAAASVVLWGLRLSAPASSMAEAAAAPTPSAPDTQAIARLLGALPLASATPTQAAAAPSRYALVGVLAARDGASGAALIAVGSAPARTYRIGAAVDGDLVLQSLGRSSASLGPKGAGASVELDLPLPTSSAKAPAQFPFLSSVQPPVQPFAQPSTQFPVSSSVPQSSQTTDQ